MYNKKVASSAGTLKQRQDIVEKWWWWWRRRSFDYTFLMVLMLSVAVIGGVQLLNWWRYVCLSLSQSSRVITKGSVLVVCMTKKEREGNVVVWIGSAKRRQWRKRRVIGVDFPEMRNNISRSGVERRHKAKGIWCGRDWLLLRVHLSSHFLLPLIMRRIWAQR